MFGYLDRLERRHGLTSVIHKARRWTWAAYGALFIIASASGFAIYRQGGAELLPVLVRLLPLLLFLPVLMTERTRGYVWLAFVSVLYFVQGYVIASLPALAWLGWLEMLASIGLFACAACVVHWRRRQQKMAAKSDH